MSDPISEMALLLFLKKQMATGANRANQTNYFLPRQIFEVLILTTTDSMPLYKQLQNEIAKESRASPPAK